MLHYLTLTRSHLFGQSALGKAEALHTCCSGPTPWIFGEFDVKYLITHPFRDILSHLTHICVLGACYPKISLLEFYQKEEEKQSIPVHLFHCGSLFWMEGHSGQ